MSSPSRLSPSTRAHYPVLVTPNQLKFFPSPDGLWNVEVLTIYNPLPFSLEIKILSTRTAAYSVDPSYASLPPQSSIKITVRLRTTLLEEKERKEKAMERGGSQRLIKSDQFMIEQFHNGTVQNKMILSVIIDTDQSNSSSINNNLLLSSSNESKKQKLLSSPSSSINNSSPPPPSHHPRIYLLPFRLFPLLLGVIIISFINSGYIHIADINGRIWLSFLIGCLTCVLQLKFFEISKYS